MACDTYTIDQYLRGKVDYSIPDEVLKAIRFDRKVSEESDVTQLDTRIIDLCLADLLMWLSNSAAVTSGAYDSDGGWQHQEANKTVPESTKRSLKQWAMGIYKQYNDPKLAQREKMVLHNLYRHG